MEVSIEEKIKEKQNFTLLKENDMVKVSFSDNQISLKYFSRTKEQYQKVFEKIEHLENFLITIFGQDFGSFLIEENKRIKSRKIKRERIHEIDLLRGILILCMWVDHFFFVVIGIMPSLVSPFDDWLNNLYYFGLNDWWNAPWRQNIRLVGLFLFLFISGLSSVLTRSNLKRGLKVTAVAVIMSVGSFLISKYILQVSRLSEGLFFYFGAIACLGVSALIFSLFEFIFKKLLKLERTSKYIYLALGIIFTVIGVVIGTYKTQGQWIAGEDLFKNWNWLKVPIGLATTGDDWMPLFPYLGYFFFGAFAGEILYKKRKKTLIPGPKANINKIENSSYRFGMSFYTVTNSFIFKPIRVAIEFFGRNTIWVYMFHQVVNIALLVIILLAKGYELRF